MRQGLLEQMKELAELFAMVNVETFIDVQGTNLEMRIVLREKTTWIYKTCNLEMHIDLQQPT